MFFLTSNWWGGKYQILVATKEDPPPAFGRELGSTEGSLRRRVGFCQSKQPLLPPQLLTPSRANCLNWESGLATLSGFGCFITTKENFFHLSSIQIVHTFPTLGTGASQCLGCMHNCSTIGHGTSQNNAEQEVQAKNYEKKTFDFWK